MGRSGSPATELVLSDVDETEWRRFGATIRGHVGAVSEPLEHLHGHLLVDEVVFREE